MDFYFFHLYGLILGIGLALGYSLARKLAVKKGLSVVVFDRVFLGMVGGGLIGARLYHVWDHWGYYGIRPWEILAVWNGGLAIYGAILGAGLIGAAVLMSLREEKSLWRWSDVFVYGALLAQVVGRWGNYVNQEAFGPPTSWPWGVFISAKKRPLEFSGFSYFQPLFLYESGWNIVGLFLLLKFRDFFRPGGRATGFYLVWYGVGRFFYEFGRFDSAVASGVKVAQVFSVMAVGVGLVVLSWNGLKQVGKMID